MPYPSHARQQVAVWVEETGREMLAKRAARVAEIERRRSSFSTDIARAPTEFDSAGLPLAGLKQRAQAPTIMIEEDIVQPLASGAPLPSGGGAGPCVARTRRNTEDRRRRDGPLLLLMGIGGGTAWRASRPRKDPASRRSQDQLSRRPRPGRRSSVPSWRSSLPAPPRTPSLASSRHRKHVERRQPREDEAGDAGGPESGLCRACDPPYTVDELGVKRFITRCL